MGCLLLYCSLFPWVSNRPSGEIVHPKKDRPSFQGLSRKFEQWNENLIISGGFWGGRSLPLRGTTIGFQALFHLFGNDLVQLGLHPFNA